MDLQLKKPLPVYHCTQAELYAIARMMWMSCLENAGDFVSMKPKYTAAFINGKIADIEFAEMLPDADARMAEHKVARAQVMRQGAKCLEHWQTLKRFIKTAYRGNRTVMQAKLAAAGSGYYREASKMKWTALKGLMHSGRSFIGEHAGELSANDNMPVGFAGVLETDAVLFETVYALFKDKEQDAVEGRGSKIVANNALYADVMEMAADGVHIYRWNAAKRNRFVWAKVKGLVTPEAEREQ